MCQKFFIEVIYFTVTFVIVSMFQPPLWAYVIQGLFVGLTGGAVADAVCRRL